MDTMIAPIADEGGSQSESAGADLAEADVTNANASIQDQDVLDQVEVRDSSGDIHQNSASNDGFDNLQMTSSVDQNESDDSAISIDNSQLTSSVAQNGSDSNVIAVRESSSNESIVEKAGILLFAHMNLDSFPPIPIDPSRLNRIDLSFNKLKNIPPVFLQNVFNNVTAFNLSFNLLKSIPEEFSSMFPKMCYLNISSNGIEKLPLSLRNCQLSTLKCVDNPLHSAIKGILGGGATNLNSDCNIAAMNLRYFFGIINFYLGLEKSTFEEKEESLRKWSENGNYKAAIFLKLLEVYRGMMDQTNENEAEENDDDILLQIKAKWAHQRFCKIVPAEVRKFNLEASMESLDSLLNSIDEKQPGEILGTQVVKEYMDVADEKMEKDLMKAAEGAEIIDEQKFEEIKAKFWTKKERRWFLSIVSVVGFIGCYLLFWPLLAVFLVSTDGMELFRRNYLSKVIPYWWTSLLADNHSWLQVRIFKFLPLFITKHLPIIDYHFPFWQQFWDWINTYFLNWK